MRVLSVGPPLNTKGKMTRKAETKNQLQEKLQYSEIVFAGFQTFAARHRFIDALKTANIQAPDAVEAFGKLAEVDECLQRALREIDRAKKLLLEFIDEPRTSGPMDAQPNFE